MRNLNWEQYLLFVFGGISCQAAALVTNPIDVIKTRLQIQGELVSDSHLSRKGVVATSLKIVEVEGVRGLYKGICASLLREGTYSTIRLGGYDLMKIKYFRANEATAHFSLWKKFVCGAVSGMIGAAVATPTDLIKVRMQAYTNAPGEANRYRNCVDGFYQVYKHEGFTGLYKGIGPTTNRAVILTATQLGSYDHIKHFLLKNGFEEGLLLHFLASTMAGLVAALATSPVDLIKTRVMNQIVSSEPLIYKNSFDCLIKTVSKEGLLGLYKGFFPNWVRIGPHTIVTFIVNEKLRTLSGISPV